MKSKNTLELKRSLSTISHNPGLTLGTTSSFAGEPMKMIQTSDGAPILVVQLARLWKMEVPTHCYCADLNLR